MIFRRSKIVLRALALSFLAGCSKKAGEPSVEVFNAEKRTWVSGMVVAGQAKTAAGGATLLFDGENGPATVAADEFGIFRLQLEEGGGFLLQKVTDAAGKSFEFSAAIPEEGAAIIVTLP